MTTAVGLPVCLVSPQPVSVDTSAPLAQGLGSPLATIAVYEGRLGETNARVLFAAEKEQMLRAWDECEDEHPHILIEPWQRLAQWNPN